VSIFVTKTQSMLWSRHPGPLAGGNPKRMDRFLLAALREKRPGSQQQEEGRPDFSRKNAGD